MWSRQLAESYTSVQSLREAGLLAPDEADRLASLGDRYQIRVTPYYAGLMSNEPDCPIRLQAIPALGEEDPATLPEWATEWSRRVYGRASPWTSDPIGDLDRLAAPRLTHRYGNRAILHLSTMCAVYCRFCFRKSHLNEREASLYDGSLDPAFGYLASHPEIRELILTGGDPLSLTDAALARVLDRASGIPSLRVVRIHSRMAVTLPDRLSEELAAELGRERVSSAGHGLSVHLVSHFNHPREWTRDAREGLGRLRRAGVPLFNQNVILRGVNDSSDTLAELYQGLYEAGVTPMYLHYPDWTPGTFQFRPGVSRAQAIARSLRGRLPGAAIPHLVVDLPGGLGKVSLTDATTREIEAMPEKAARETGVSGAVYEVSSPRTRDGQGTPLYLDLFGWPAARA
jgi:lysine 2,3-aminomutase